MIPSVCKDLDPSLGRQGLHQDKHGKGERDKGEGHMCNYSCNSWECLLQPPVGTYREGLPPGPTGSPCTYYAQVWDSAELPKYFTNSVIVAIPGVILTLFLASFVAFWHRPDSASASPCHCSSSSPRATCCRHRFW
ncbi:hypothetical protein GCM10020218_100930 [Dactylosporangium vinaceum]